jgi:RNA 2',3'-cyclic 3'-phosphodiesterase
VSEALEVRLRDARRALDAHCFRWVKRERLHVTLRFFGRIAAEQVVRLGPALEAAAQETPIMTGRFGSVLALPSWRRPNVAAVVLDTQGALEALAARIEARLLPDFGWPDKPFLAHLTVLRIRRPRRSDLELAEALLTRMSFSDMDTFELDRMSLFRSDLERAGPRYTALCELPFRRG